MSNSAKKPRRQFRNINVVQLLKYRLPLAGRLSIMHRVSGALMFLLLPVLILPLFAMSMSPTGFDAFVAVASMPIVKIVFLVVIWAFLHHFCAGIRYLMLDTHRGLDKYSAQKSAGVVFGASLGLTFVFALKLFGVW